MGLSTKDGLAFLPIPVLKEKKKKKGQIPEFHYIYLRSCIINVESL